jgi:hypothetical protein
MRLLQIVPGFGKTDNALFDYAKVLAEELNKKGIESIFDIEKVEECDAVFLNYVGYGYEKRGVPLKLLFRLWYWVHYKKKPLYIFFHELYVTDNATIYNSGFWVAPLQKWIYLKLYEMCINCFTSTEAWISRIQNQTKDKGGKAVLTGLFCNIPELQEYISFASRQPVAIVFGSYNTRKVVYENYEKVNSVCAALGITRIIDIGKGSFESEWKNIKVTIDAKEVLSTMAIAHYFKNASFGFINYNVAVLGKSGVFAAYAAYGLVVINFTDIRKECCDLLLHSQHFLYWDDMDLLTNKPDQMETISSSLYQWYQLHNVFAHTELISQKILNR